MIEILLFVIIIILAAMVYLLIRGGNLVQESGLSQKQSSLPQIIPYIDPPVGSNGPPRQQRDVNNPVISTSDFAVYSKIPASLSASRPGARSLLIKHRVSTNPFDNNGDLFDSVTYPLGLLIGGSVLYSLPIVNLKLTREAITGQSSLDANFLNEINVVCGAEFSTDEKQQLQLTIQKEHLPQDGDPSDFWTWVNRTSTDNGPLNPCTWTFELDFAARNGLVHTEPDGEPYFDELDDMAPLALWRTTT